MIFNISTQFANSYLGRNLSDICCKMIYNRHYILCDSTTRGLITTSIKSHGSTSQKELFLQYKGFDITDEFRKYFTTINVDQFSYSKLDIMLTQPSRLLIENSYNEWNTYKSIMGAYKHDKKYKNLFIALEQAKNENRISYLHGGGYTTYVSLIEQNNSGDYSDVFKYKVCVIFDRDTNNASYYDMQKNTLFKFLCGKECTQIIDEDIYSLNQCTYIWHMWYKRSIENYFPNIRFQVVGVNTAVIPMDKDERDFYDFSNATGYSKNKLAQLPQDMGRANYEKGLKKFVVNGEEMTELQLLLLKFVKII